MILVQDRLRTFEIEVFLRRFRPGQRHHHVQIIAQRGGFGGVRMHSLELLDLAVDFLLDGFRHCSLNHLLPILPDFLGKLVSFSQLGLYCLELLPQIELSLCAIDFAFGLSVDLLLNEQDVDLAGEQLVDAAQPVGGVQPFEHSLRVGDFQLQI